MQALLALLGLLTSAAAAGGGGGKKDDSIAASDDLINTIKGEDNVTSVKGTPTSKYAPYKKASQEPVAKETLIKTVETIADKAPTSSTYVKPTVTKTVEKYTPTKAVETVADKAPVATTYVKPDLTKAVAKYTPTKTYKDPVEPTKPAPEVTQKSSPEPVAKYVASKPSESTYAPKTEVATKQAPEQAPEPTPVTSVAAPTASAPTASIIAPTAPTQGGSTAGGETDPTSVVSGSFSVEGGRVTTLEVQNADNVASVRVLEGPDHGNLTVNPDNTLALVMSMDHSFSGNLNLSYEVSYNDGSSQVFSNNVYVRPSAQGDGWGQGEHYMLETDAQGDLIVEAGENHRDVFISGSNDALSVNEIAQMAGISPDQVTGSWLADNPQYGGTEGMALDLEAGMRVWNEITGPGAAPSSNWLQFERGYEYDDFGGNYGDYLRVSNVEGESELHPVHITAYGTGAKPVLRAELVAEYNNGAQNLVISDVEVTQGTTIFHSENVILDGVSLTNVSTAPGNLLGFYGEESENLTIRNSEIVDVYRTVHPTGGSSWNSGSGLTQGAYISEVDGLLIEGNTFDHNGWAPDYREDGSTEGGEGPIMFNHNLYLQDNTRDVTLRDNIIMRGASFGAHVRGGGFVEDNLFLDNNVAVDILGGDYRGAGPVGNFSLFTDNVITSAGNKDLNTFNGAIARGVDNRGEQTTLLDNIIAHLADPNNAAEQASKTTQSDALIQENGGTYYDDTIIHNWLSASGSGTTGVNTDGLSTTALDATTIQAFTQQLLGNSNATIDDLANVLRAQADSGQLDNVVDSDLIIAFFQTGFGVAVDGRIDDETIRFVPNDLGDGVRWDNRLNWETQDLPGTVAGDSVDLGGNYVNFGGSSTVDQLDFGAGGTLNVSSGRLNVEEFMTLSDGNAQLNISQAGQVWSNGLYQRADDPNQLDLNIDGGRFANTGLFHGNADIDITDGQAILATDGADFILRDGSELEIIGDNADVGFDGGYGGTGVLLMDEGSTLHFDAEGNRLGTIEEFRSGAYGENGPNIQSGVNLGDGTLQLDLAGWSGGASSNTLINVDEVIGEFGEINVTGLAGNRDAELVVNYDDDTVVLNISAAGEGSGQVTNTTTGDANNAAANDDLWAALTNGHGIYQDDTSDVEEEEDFLAEVA